jgi:uncharacterized membrane protein
MEIFTGREIAKDSLKHFNVYVLPGTYMGQGKMTEKQKSSVADFVKNGGGLLIYGNASAYNPYGHKSNIIRNELLQRFGKQQLNNVTLLDKDNCTDEEPRQIIFNDIKQHPITQWVHKYDTLGSCSIAGVDPANVLIASSKTCSEPGATVLAAFEYGKGRVAVCGESSWTHAQQLCKGDNAQLYLNMIRWLSGRPPRQLNAEEVEKIHDMPDAVKEYR